MDRQNKEESFSPDESLPGPPTLNQSTLDFGYVPQGSQKTLQQIIANTTKWPMIWLADAHESRWLILELDHGVLQPGEQQSIRVTADTTSLEIGAHSATLTFSSEGDESSMSKDTTGKIIVEEPHKLRAPRPLEVGLDFGFLTPHSTSTLALLISNPDDRPVEWRIQIGKDKLGMGVRETLEHSARPAGIRESFSIEKEQGVILSETEGPLQPHKSHTIYVTINTANLEPGYAYRTDLTLTSQVVSTATSVHVPLTFDVSIPEPNDGGPRVPTDLPPNINLTIQRGQLSGSYALCFTNDDEKVVDWKLASDTGATWLVPSPSRGTFGPKEQAKVRLTGKRARLSAGYYNTNLHLHLTWNDGTPGETDARLIPIVLTVK
jgi:hypothetical protein